MLPSLLLALVSLAELPAVAVLSVLAVLQGLTEFLPVSSSGHLVLAQAAMGIDDPAIVVDVALHVGTLFAVLVVYRRDLASLARGLFDGRWREPLLLVLGTLPAVVVGLGFRDQVEVAFESPRTAAYGLFATAAMLFAGEAFRRRRLGMEPGPLSWRIALGVGIAQALAICPGISRSGSTIACGLALGLAPAAAARFSFLLAIPAIGGAALLQLPAVLDAGRIDHGGELL